LNYIISLQIFATICINMYNICWGEYHTNNP